MGFVAYLFLAAGLMVLDAEHNPKQATSDTWHLRMWLD